ncbi:hypothetical protein FQY83_12290 [Luteimonas marina]|uniref:Uncharacterized protein n=1 Tax=Luteimonas marina TaxID=488485 RepID=A0A5C5U134_9GAMM|nr:hypothetical protein [Luteimonas marina]TWT19140.1 hypothetical protein FQY83_12290 [Luteimonas marina]
MACETTRPYHRGDFRQAGSARAMDSVEALEAFVARHGAALHWILKDASGAWAREDLRSEAYWSLLELQADSERPLDLQSETDAARGLDHMRRRARLTGGHIHRIQRPDQAGDEDGHRGIAGWDRFLADEGEHPATLLEALESMAVEEPVDPSPYHSPAAGWIHLLRRFDNHVARLAAFLLISPSWCYACFREARHLAMTQWPLPQPAAVGDDQDALQPWRSFKLPTRHRDDLSAQLTLDFRQPPAQPASGQLWLLQASARMAFRKEKME